MSWRPPPARLTPGRDLSVGEADSWNRWAEEVSRFLGGLVAAPPIQTQQDVAGMRFSLTGNGLANILNETIINNITITNLTVINETVTELIFISTTITTITNITNVSGASKLLFQSSANGTISTLTGGVAGQILFLENTGTGNVTLGTSGNIITPLGLAYTLWPNDGCILQFDGTSWRFDVPTFAVQNLNSPNNLEYACREIIAANDQGSSAFSRIFFDNSPGGGEVKAHWQGQRGTVDGSTFVGPQPDTWLKAGVCGVLTIAVAVDAASGTIKYTLDANGLTTTAQVVISASFNSTTCVLSTTTETLHFTCGVLTSITTP